MNLRQAAEVERGRVHYNRRRFSAFRALVLILGFPLAVLALLICVAIFGQHTHVFVGATIVTMMILWQAVYTTESRIQGWLKGGKR